MLCGCAGRVGGPWRGAEIVIQRWFPSSVGPLNKIRPARAQSSSDHIGPQFNSPDNLHYSKPTLGRWQRKHRTSLKKSSSRLRQCKVRHQYVVALNVVTEHYVKKDLLSRQIASEIHNLSSPTALARFGGPFTPLDPLRPVTAATTDFPFLRFVFVNFVQSFPFLPDEQQPLWQDKVQPVSRPISPSLQSSRWRCKG